MDLIDDPKCVLCGKPAILEHILSEALNDGKYTIDYLQCCLRSWREISSSQEKEGLKFVNFVKEDENGIG